MKKIKITTPFLLIAALAMFFASCSNDSSKHIPKDAFAVLVIDGGELTKLSDTDFIQENPEYEDAMKEVEKESEKAAELIEDILEDPDASGVLLTEKMYAFATIEEEEDIVIGVIIPIKRKKLEENLDMIADEFGVPISMVMETEDDIQYFAPEDGMILGWNDDVFMYVFQENGEDMFDLLEKYMNLDKKESILSDKDFKKFQKNCTDINLWVSSNIIDNIDYESKEIEEFEKLTGIDLSNNYGHMHLDIEKDEIVYTSKLKFNESIQELDKKKIIDNAEKIADLLEEPLEVLEMLDLFGGSQDDEWDDYYYDDDYYDEWNDYEEMTDEEWEQLLQEYESEYDEMTDEEWEELLNELEVTETE